MTDAQHRDPADERAILAKMLSANATFVSEVLHPAEGTPTPSVMAALRAARSLDNVVDDVLRSLVQQARDEGRTWAEVGEIFGTSRQAAFQRFGGGGGGMPIVPPPPAPFHTMPEMPPPPEMPKMPQVPGWPPTPPAMGWPPQPGQPPRPGPPPQPGQPGQPPQPGQRPPSDV
ncbi:hypothetical protein [Nocardia sp. NBC_01388]|uniref:hypothetical protein n=1 Tax=Nocardia sp. NBC_01388 TaxID=2903596 RepID=UPI00324847A7